MNHSWENGGHPQGQCCVNTPPANLSIHALAQLTYNGAHQQT